MSNKPGRFLSLHAGSLLFYCVLVVIATWPIAGSFGEAIPGSEGDAWVHFWTFRFVRDQLLSQGSLFFTDKLFFPNGVSLLQHNFAWFHIALWLPLQALLGEATAYSLIFLAGFVFTAFSTRLFVLEITNSEIAGLIAGVVAGLWPYTLSHHNHPNLIFIGFVPLALLALRRLQFSPSRSGVFWLAVTLALMGIVRWQQLVYVFPLISLYWLHTLISSYKQRQAGSIWKPVGYTLAALAIATVLMLPLLQPFLAGLLDESISAETLNSNETDLGNSDLFAYIIPSRYHVLFGEQIEPLTQNLGINRTFIPWPGYLALLFFLLAPFISGKKTRIWQAIALLYVLLALGTQLTINGAKSIPLPWALLQDTFIDALVRRTDRFNVLLSLPIAILVGHIVAQIDHHLKKREHNRLRWLVPILIVLIMLFEYSVRYPMFALSTPQWYSQQAEIPRQFAILDLPMSNYSYDEQYMYYQFTHGKPLVGGHVSRSPQEAFEFIRTVPMLAENWLEPNREMRHVGQQLHDLSRQNIPYIVLHKQFLPDDRLNIWRDWLVLPPVHESGEIVVYVTDPRKNDAYAQGVSLIKNAAGESTLTLLRDQSLLSPDAENKLTVNVVWGNQAGSGQNESICFELYEPGTGEVWEVGCRLVSAENPTQNWHPYDIVHATYTLNIPEGTVPDGYYQLQARAQSAASSQTVPIAPVVFTTDGRLFTKPSPTEHLSLEWENGIALIGYDATADNTGIDLTLYWQALSTQAVSLVYFLHVVDIDTNNLVAQLDTVPRNWQYPADLWSEGEYVPDTVHLDLPPGNYQVRVGLYPIGGQDRIGFTNAQQPITDGIAPLFEIDTRR